MQTTVVLCVSSLTDAPGLDFAADLSRYDVLMHCFDLAFFCYLHSSQELRFPLLCLSHFKAGASQPKVTSGY